MLNNADLQEAPRVIVVLQGGCCINVCSEVPLNVAILDHDDASSAEDEAPEQVAQYEALEEECERLPYSY